MELGVYTLAELRADPQIHETISPEQQVRNLLEEIELAGQVGLDLLGRAGGPADVGFTTTESRSTGRSR